MTQDDKPTSPYLTVEQAANRLLVKPTTMRNWRNQKLGPVFRAHGGRIVYLMEDLDAWSDSQKHQTAKPRKNLKLTDGESE